MTPNEPSDIKRLSFSNTLIKSEVSNDAIIPAANYKAPESDISKIDNTILGTNKVVDNPAPIVNQSIKKEPTKEQEPKQKEVEVKQKEGEVKNSVDTITTGSLGVTSNQSINRVLESNKQKKNILKQGEEEMAEVDTNMLSNQHADIRREASVYAGETRYDIANSGSDIRRELADTKDVLNDSIRVEGGATRTASASQTSDIIKEGIKGDWHNSDAIKDTRFDLSNRMADNTANLSQQIDRIDDTTMAQFMTVARDTADLRAQIVQAIDTTKLATELNALKGIIEGQRNTTYLSDKISGEADRTRALINDLKYHDLSRGLIERTNELVEERNWGRHWYAGANQAQFGQQFAQLQSQMQNFNSQLSETRQGMVNFGTMAGVGQTSSANNVR